MTNSEKDNYSNTFFKIVFDDSMDLDYNIKITMGDFNVAPNHKMDTSGYLHINNPNSRQFLDKMIPLNMMTDVFRHKHPDLRQYTFHKKQTKNYTRARLDYFLMSDDSLDMVKKVGIGKASSLSDHRPIYLHIALSKVQKGRGFWRLNNDFLYDPVYIIGCKKNY